jgi:sulfonate transport system ATP-binding protein
MNAHPALTARQHPVVQVSNLVRSFGRGPNILDGLDLTIRAGEFVALLGRSGSGKSTLLRTLAGLDKAPAGTVTVPTERAVVFQEPRLIPWKRVWANVALGLRRPDTRERAVAALSEVGLSHRLEAWPLTLSGGEAQRAALARALVREPKLLLLDEPFAALDALTRLKTQSLVASLWRAHRPAVLLVTHDVDEALLLADRVLVLDQGRIGFDLHVNLERPRRHAQPAFATLRSRLLRELGVEEENPEEPIEELRAPARSSAPAASAARQNDAVWAASADALARL